MSQRQLGLNRVALRGRRAHRRMDDASAIIGKRRQADLVWLTDNDSWLVLADVAARLDTMSCLPRFVGSERAAAVDGWSPRLDRRAANSAHG